MTRWRAGGTAYGLSTLQVHGPDAETNSSPAASSSTTCTWPVAARGPRFCTTMFDVIRLSASLPMPSHTAMSSGVLVFVSDRSAPSASTVNVTLPVLLSTPLPGLFGSGVAEVMVAALVTSPLLFVPLAGTVATMVIVSTAPTGMSALRVQVRVLLVPSLTHDHAAG